MENSLFISLLALIWRWSVFLMFPLLVIVYSLLTGLPLADFDNGVNRHKWLIVMLYLLYVGVWLKYNPRVSMYLERWGR